MKLAPPTPPTPTPPSCKDFIIYSRGLKRRVAVDRSAWGLLKCFRSEAIVENNDWPQSVLYKCLGGNDTYNFPCLVLKTTGPSHF